MPATILYSLCFSQFYGTQQSVLSTARSLDPERYRPIVAAPYHKRFFGFLHDEGIQAVDIPFGSPFDLRSAVKIKKALNRNNVDLVHAHLGISTFLSVVSTIGTSIPVIATRHFVHDRYATIPNPLLRSIYAGLYSLMNSRLSRTIFISGAVRDSVMSRESIPEDRTVIVHNCISTENSPARENHTDEDIAALRRRFDIPADRFLVVTLSRLAPEKDLETLLRAAAVLKTKGFDNLYFAVAGGGNLKNHLQELSDRLGVSDIVDLKGYLDDAKLLLSVADAFCLSALEEPFGISVLEAMAAGIPVVAADSGGPREIIHHGSSGLLFPPGDPEALALRLADIITGPAMAASLVDAARRRLRDFDEAAVALKTQALYDDVLGRA